MKPPRCFFCGKFVPVAKAKDGEATCAECDRTDEDIRQLLMEAHLMGEDVGW